jgi:DNA relaxase NicK
MVYLEIDKNNYEKRAKNSKKNLIETLDDSMGNKKNQVFLLIYMEGCGPCNATRPEWKKIENVLSKDFLNRDDVVIASIDQILINDLKNLATPPPSFPTMRFITNGGKTVENYEDSDITTKDRTIDSFIEWIKHKTGETDITVTEIKGGSKNAKVRTISKSRKHKKSKIRTRKWSLKYKRSINCRKPRGFSQKQYCKYGRKK